MLESLEKCISRKKMVILKPNIHEAQVPDVEVQGITQDASTLLCYALVGRRESTGSGGARL